MKTEINVEEYLDLLYKKMDENRDKNDWRRADILRKMTQFIECMESNDLEEAKELVEEFF